MRIIGIDPGLTGAIAFLNERFAFKEREAGVMDLPTSEFYPTGAVRRALTPPLLKEALDSLREQDEWQPCVIEKVHAGGAGQGASSNFSLGMSLGMCIQAATDAGYEVVLVKPEEWKKHFGLPRDKSASIAKAVSLWPALEEDFLARKKDHNRAEALLLARWFQETSAWT